jgi:hypothetical protein
MSVILDRIEAAPPLRVTLSRDPRERGKTFAAPGIWSVNRSRDALNIRNNAPVYRSMHRRKSMGPPISADAAAAMKDVIVKALCLTLLVVGGNGLLCIVCIDCWYI